MYTELEEQYDKIYRYCYFKVRKPEVAEDITQETFLRFYERFGHYGDEWTLKYLYRIAHNLCVDEYKKPHMEQLLEEIPERSSEEDVVGKIWVQEAVNGLLEEEKELLLLRYVNEVPVNVIGRIFGISRFAVYRKLKGAERKLRSRLGEEGHN